MAGVFVEFPAPQDFRFSVPAPSFFGWTSLPSSGVPGLRTDSAKKLRENFAQLFPYFCAEIGVARSKRWTVLTYTRKRNPDSGHRGTIV